MVLLVHLNYLLPVLTSTRVLVKLLGRVLDSKLLIRTSLYNVNITLRMRRPSLQQTKMATRVLVCFWLLTVVVASLIRDSATQIVMLDSFNSVENCDAMCTTAFADSEASCIYW